MAFLGRRLVANLSLQKLESDRFAASRLVGKLANICPDLPSAHLNSTSTFKALTGGDPIQAEYKYRDTFELLPYARLVFSANHPPRSGDASHAFYRRWLVIPFDRTFEEHEQRPREELDAELADPREQSGLLNMAVEAWRKVKSGGFSESESTRRALEEFRDTTDPLSVWLEKNTVEHTDAVVSKQELRDRYWEYCEERGIPRGSSKAFDSAVRRSKPHLEEKQRTWRGVSNTRCWVGIGLVSEEDNHFGGWE
jgi:putative DNA primase/helicase